MERLQRLLAELCAGLDADETREVVETGRLEIDEVALVIDLAGELDPDAAIALFDLGPLPADETNGPALLRMLELNRCLFSQRGAMFGVDPGTGDAVLMLRIALPGLAADGLRQTLAEHSAIAQAWRETRFADGSLAAHASLAEVNP